MAIEHADFDGIERLALVTGGEIASTFDDPQNLKLGRWNGRGMSGAGVSLSISLFVL